MLMILSGSSHSLIVQIITDLKSTFALKDLGDLHYLLGIQVTQNTAGLLLS